MSRVAVAVQALSFYSEIAEKNHRGLVPMVFLSSAMPYKAGDIAGFVPKDARAMHVAGQAEPILPEGVKVPAAEPERSGVPAAEAEEIIRLNAIDVSPAIFAEDPLSQVAKAAEIKNLGKKATKPTPEQAVEIINAELKRREDYAETNRQRTLATNGVVSSASGLPVAA